MMTPGQASRTACWISLLTLTSHDGRWPLLGSCWRRWICMMLAPALKAALASRAICSGVTGTLCCFGSVSTPFSAQVMTALSLMDQPSEVGGNLWRDHACRISRLLASTRCSRRRHDCCGRLQDRARLQPVEAADRVAEMGRIGIADILREMREVDVLVGEMQQMPRPFPGAERAKRNAGLFLEQMQEARRRQSGFRSTACRRHRLAGEFSDLQHRARHARIELACGQGFAKAH